MNVINNSVVSGNNWYYLVAESYDENSSKIYTFSGNGFSYFAD